MRYEVTVTMLIDSPNDKERVARQVESVFKFGTIGDSVADALGIDESPRLTKVSIEPSVIGRRY